MKGEWHLLAGTSLFGENLSKCGKFQVSSEKSGDGIDFSVTYEGINATDGSPVKYESKSAAYKPEKASMAFGVWRKQGSEKWSGVFKQSVVATDYDSFAVYVACRHEFDAESHTFGRNMFAFILSRKPTLSKDVMNTLINFLSGYDVEPELIQVADHSNCS